LRQSSFTTHKRKKAMNQRWISLQARIALFSISLAGAATVVTSSRCDAQIDTVAGRIRRDSIVRSNSRRAVLSRSTITGPGADFIYREAANAEFVAIGERHDIREIPLIVSALLRELHQRHGFNYLATENGLLVTDYAFQGAHGSAQTSFIDYAKKFPSAFEFNSDQDLALLDTATKILHGVSRPVWGVDQEFGATHLLERLKTLGPPRVARHLLDSLISAAGVAERRRFEKDWVHWLADEARPEPFQELARLYGPHSDDETSKILAALQISSHLYDLNRRVSLGELTGFAANAEREELMKSNFAKAYNRARASGEKTPKVLIKMGSAHLGRGQSPFGPFTVGNLVSDLATVNASRSFHIAVLAHNGVADTLAPGLWKWADLRPLAEVSPSEGLTVIDLRPLRPFLYSGKLGNIGVDLRRIIYGYDAVMLVGGASNATHAVGH
jgi:hypothetical protein